MDLTIWHRYRQEHLPDKVSQSNHKTGVQFLNWTNTISQRDSQFIRKKYWFGKLGNVSFIQYGNRVTLYKQWGECVSFFWYYQNASQNEIKNTIKKKLYIIGYYDKYNSLHSGKLIEKKEEILISVTDVNSKYLVFSRREVSFKIFKRFISFCSTFVEIRTSILKGNTCTQPPPPRKILIKKFALYRLYPHRRC